MTEINLPLLLSCTYGTFVVVGKEEEEEEVLVGGGNLSLLLCGNSFRKTATNLVRLTWLKEVFSPMEGKHFCHFLPHPAMYSSILEPKLSMTNVAKDKIYPLKNEKLLVESFS